jgi:hypothetical protein
MVRRVAMSLVALSLVAAGVAWAGAGTAMSSVVRYSHTWSPPLNLPSSYRSCCTSTAAWTTLPFTMSVSGTQGFNLGVRLRTNWVDTKAVGDTPNIIQQGRFDKATLVKLSIHSGAKPGAHHAQCVIRANGVSVIAPGPKNIDVADGRWHYIICVKFGDTASGTNVRVYVDGVAGELVHTSRRIGNIVFSNDAVDLGGRSSTASRDSIDGRYEYVVFTVA